MEQGDTGLAAALLEAGAPAGALDFDQKAPLHLALEVQASRVGRGGADWGGLGWAVEEQKQILAWQESNVVQYCSTAL